MKIMRKSTGSRTRRIVMLAFPDAQIIDITGPLEVFGRAARWMTDPLRPTTGGGPERFWMISPGPLRSLHRQ